MGFALSLEFVVFFTAIVYLSAGRMAQALVKGQWHSWLVALNWPAASGQGDSACGGAGQGMGGSARPPTGCWRCPSRFPLCQLGTGCAPLCALCLAAGSAPMAPPPTPELFLSRWFAL